MASYLLLSSRDPFEVDVSTFWDLAANLKKEGNDVTLFLVQNGVLPARKSTRSDALSKLAQAGVEVLADDFSLRERGIPSDRLAAGVKAAAIDVVIDQMAEGRKTIWA
jgi:predicted peroxiredoxin